MEKKSLKTTMKENSIPKMMEYFQEFKQGQKPLGEKAETKCRAAAHKDIAEFVSWMTIKGIDWNENKTDLETVKIEIEKSISRFGPKFFMRLQNHIDKWQSVLNQKGKHETASRIPDTMYVATQKVLEKDLGTAIDFSCNPQTANADKVKKELTA